MEWVLGKTEVHRARCSDDGIRAPGSHEFIYKAMGGHSRPERAKNEVRREEIDRQL